MMCDRYGGAFSPSGEVSGARCSWKDGSATLCNKKEQCVIVEKSAVRVDPGLPMLQPVGTLEAVG